MQRWRLLQYVSPQGRRESIADWRKKLPIGRPRSDLDTFLAFMVKLKEWEYPYIDSLKSGPYKGLTELRWKSGRVPYRIFGYQTGASAYVMLIGCTHNEKRYDPPDAMDTAKRRRNEILKGEASTSEYKLIADWGDAEQGIS